MRKSTAKLLILLLIIKLISPILNIGDVFAVSNTWDFNIASNYTLSDTDVNHIKIENSLVRLPYHLEHLGAITDISLDQARRVFIKGNYAFVSAYNADKLLSIDISDPTNPIIAFTLSNGDQGINLNGPIGLASTGSYLYVAGYLSDNINIIDITDPTNLSFVKEIADNNLNQQLNGAKDIKISGSHLYVTSYVDDAFNVFDNSDPSNPSYKKNIQDHTKLDGANRAKIDGTYAYITSDRNDSFEIIDLTNQDSLFQNISIVGELTDGTAGALLNGARSVSFSGNLAYVSSNISDALEIIDTSDKTNPIHTGSIINGNPVKLNAPRSTILYNGFNFSSARASDAIEVVNINNPTNPVHESEITKVAGTILLNGANDIVNSGSLFYVAGNVDDSLEILKAKYSTNSPYIIPTTTYNYTGSINTFSETLSTNNQGNITYQISYDNGTNWKWFNGTNWLTTITGVTESNSAYTINSNLYSFNGLNSAGTGNFLFKAFLNSDGNKKVELDKVNITTIENPTEILDPVLWYDGQDTDGDGNFTNEPVTGTEVSPLTDKFNLFNAYSNTSGEIPTYNTGIINNHPNLNLDGVNDHYIIDNQNLINTSTFYQKTFSTIFKTSNDITTFQNIYEQGGTGRGYNIQIENSHLYAGVFNNQERAVGDQYKFVDLGVINPNQTYYLTMIQESTSSKTLDVYLDSNLISSLPNVDYQRSHGGGIGLGYVNGNIIKASDNSSTNGPAYFKGNIGEFLSWNHALSPKERQGIDMYLKNKWGLTFKIYPIITGSNINDYDLFKTGNGLNIQFYYKDGNGGSGIDTSTALLNISRLESGTFGTDLSGSLIDAGQTNITTSTGSYFGTGQWLQGEYKATFTIGNVDGNSILKNIYFYIDPLGIPWKVLDIDLEDPNADGGQSFPTNGNGLALIKDKFYGYNAYQATTGSQALYYSSGIINPNNPGIVFDGIDDEYNIDNQYDLNTASKYDEKSFSYVFKTGNDVDTFQNIYEQGGGSRGYAIQVQSGSLYMGTWNNVEWVSGDQ